MSFDLSKLDKHLRQFLATSLIVLSVGVTMGLYFIHLNTNSKPSGIVKHYNGNEASADEFEIKYGKSLKDLVLTVHNHVISFVFIFFLLGIIFYGVHTIHPKLKQFLLIEPFISILITFSSMFLIRYISADFVLLMIISSCILYFSFFMMVFYCLRELIIGVRG